MKKITATVLAAMLILAAAGCNSGTTAATTTAAQDTTTAATEAATEAAADTDAKSEGVMTYAEYAAAAVDTEVVVETYVQAKQSWWDNKGTFYTQDKDGAYFLYEMPCTEEEYNKLVPGTKIKVKGFKAEWSGEYEIIDSSFEIEEGSYIADPVDVTDLLGKDELAEKQNIFASFKGLTIQPSTAEDGTEAAWLYKWNGTGAEGDDLYFSVSDGTNTYTFTVESYLCGADTEVYKTVKELNVGDVVDMEGFLYWYNGANPHITSVTVTGKADVAVSDDASDAKSEGVMTYAEYAAADVDSQVVVETYVQAKQSWWDNKGTFYTQDKDGAYFLYEMPCTEEEYDKLVPGTKIKVTGYKAEWSGEYEIIDTLFEVEDGSYIAEPEDVTALLGTDELINKQNKFVSFKNMIVQEKTAEDGTSAAWLYKWNGTGAEGDDLYFDVSDGVNTYTFTVESYLCGADTDVYKAVKALNVGDVIDMEGFLYWYNGANPHITSVKMSEGAAGEEPAYEGEIEVSENGLMTFKMDMTKFCGMVDDSVNFLTEEQNVAYNIGKNIFMNFDTAPYTLFSDRVKSNVKEQNAHLSEYTTAADGLHTLTGFTYDSVKSEFLKYISEDIYNEVVSDKVTDDNGEFAVIDGGRGGNIFFKDIEFEPVSSDDNKVEFKGIAHYYLNGDDIFTENPDAEIETMEYNYEMVKEADGWKLTKFALWM